ncbi:uncharacterized protein Z518_05832 [Rhinocladiella mackenziei CBS 650.93]|uniref:C2H2-type domain-containing protein n=1 Tax=Rhinocladiella mackenziei CBS 650.93 TaxID=1442369 RepID=A0A0D2J7B3_9EURO|nr:uncharacterized protein Z518_05832 [Rhinocladiella mackenziei CBS 650.93]KIX04960.1 hypothetical protein Z518_05832 [Rhinocladiella mackenziei CBS 650.93]
MVEQEIQSFLVKLFQERDSRHYYDKIRDCLKMDDRCWKKLCDLRGDCELYPFLRKHHQSIHDSPSPRIFEILVQIRLCKSWARHRGGVIDLIDQTIGPTPHTSQTPSHASVTHLTPGSAPSIRSNSHESKSRFPLYDPSPANLSVRPPDHGRHDGSPSSTNDLFAAVPTNNGNGGRTAPEGHRFCCPSKNCKKNYSRQGDYENHMQSSHNEWPPHDPQNHLRKISHTGQLSADVVEEQPLGNSSATLSPLTPQPNPFGPMTPVMPCTAPISSHPQAQTGLSHLLTQDTSVLGDLQAIGAQMPLTPQQISNPPLITNTMPSDDWSNSGVDISGGGVNFLFDQEFLSTTDVNNDTFMDGN